MSDYLDAARQRIAETGLMIQGEPPMLAIDVARMIGASRKAWSSYVSRGQAPAARAHVGRFPVWSAPEVRAWHEARSGIGWRAAHPERWGKVRRSGGG